MEEKKQGIYEKLSMIQNEMKVGKNQYNKFGKYKYRSAEDILAEAKKVCMKYRTTLIISDNVIYIENRFYVVAHAILKDWDSYEEIKVEAMAREEESKKGMDASQVTGACSSYARKYALNGLFSLDDTKDADTDEQHEQIQNSQQAHTQAKKVSAEDEVRMRCFKAQNALQKLGIDVRSEEFVKHILVEYGIQSQDIANLKGDGLANLLKCYTEIYQENRN